MKKSCSICGSVLDSKTSICPNCTDAKTGIYNENISDWHNNVPTNGNGSEDKKKKIITIVAIVVAVSILLGIFGVGGYLIGRGKNPLPKAYDQVVEMYKQLLIDGNADGNQLSGALVNKIRESDDYEISYSYIDINDDKTKELIIGGHENGSGNVEVYDVFTMDEEENAVQLFNVENFNDDTEIVIYNEVIKVSEEKEETTHFEYLKLPENQWEVEKDEEYLYEDSTYYEVNDGDKAEISQEDYDEADNKYEGEELDLEWVKVVIEEDVKEKDDNATALTEAQIKSFEKFLSDSYEELFYIQKYTSDVYSLTYCHFFGFSVYRHYFDTEPKLVRKEMNGNYYSNYYMEYDAQEILFILNDVYGLNISESSSDGLKYYFDNGKYYCNSATAGENQEPVNLHNLVIDSQSKLDDGYFKIEFTYTTSYDTVINSQSTHKGYFIVKPATHETYGDYWKIKDFNMFIDIEETTSETTTPETTTKKTTEKPKSNDAEIYQEYLKNGGLSNFMENMNIEGNRNSVEIKSCLIDMNNDGTSELLFTLTDIEGPAVKGYEEYGVVLAIQNNKVVQLTSAYNGGGSMGGEHLYIKYDANKNKHIVFYNETIYDGTFSSTSSNKAYSYDGNKISSYINFSNYYYNQSTNYYDDIIREHNSKTTTYVIKDENKYYYYVIGNEYVTQNNYQFTYARFQDPTDSRYKMKKGTWNNPLAL